MWCKRWLFGLLFLGLWLTVGAAEAQPAPLAEAERERVASLLAQVQRAADPAQALAQLPEAEQALVVEYGLKTTRVVERVIWDLTHEAIETTVGGCLSPTFSRAGKNAFGQTLWEWRHQIHYCWDGSVITDITPNPYGVTYFPFWSWDLKGTTPPIGDKGDPWAYRWAQGEFKLCINGEGWGCVEYSYPFIEVTVYGTGQFSASGGG